MRSKVSLGQRSSSGSDDHENLVKSIACESQNGFARKKNLSIYLRGSAEELVRLSTFKVMGSKVKVTETFAGEGITIHSWPLKTMFVL